MELKDLAGLRVLTGASTENKSIPSSWDEDEFYDASLLSLILDGVIYTAIEDNNDGYRSAMQDLLINKYECKNTFPPVDIFCLYETQGRGYNSCDLLRGYELKTGKLIFEMGTDNTDDYYPSFVGNFNAENVNQVS